MVYAVQLQNSAYYLMFKENFHVFASFQVFSEIEAQIKHFVSCRIEGSDR